MKDDDVILISAYLDNELSQSDRDKVEDRLETEPEFSALFAEFDQLDTSISQSVSAIDDKPLPTELEALLFDKPSNVEPIQIRTKSSLFNMSRFLPMAAAIATVAIAVPLYFVNLQAERLVMADVLNTGQSGLEYTLSNDSLVRISMTFENNDAQICREYFVVENNASTVAQQTISCRVNESWEQVITANVLVSSDGNFQPASAQSAREIESWLDQNMASDAYSLAQEAEIFSK